MQEFEREMASMEPVSEKKPKMRGVLHRVAVKRGRLACSGS